MGNVHRLSVLMGQASGSLMELMKRGHPIPRPRLPMPVGIPADALMSRPDIRPADAHSRRLQVGSAKSKPRAIQR